MSYKSYTKSCLAILIFAAFLNGNSSSYAYNSQAIQNYNQAVDFSKNGDFEQAIESFKKSVELDPAFSDAYYNLASLYEFMGKGDLALKYYELAHKHNIKDTESAYKCAIMYFDKKNYSKSSFFLKAIPQSSDKYAQAQALQKKITDIEKQQSANAQQKPVQPATTTAQKPVQTATPDNRPKTLRKRHQLKIHP
ncbi:MAG: tetratricopeptide repeat protein [Candidatus Moduliflexus flocculans]|nr:tetratricopeptide repeat protein [Candidatus Moduliflexus flocculans]